MKLKVLAIVSCTIVFIAIGAIVYLVSVSNKDKELALIEQRELSKKKERLTFLNAILKENAIDQLSFEQLQLQDISVVSILSGEELKFSDILTRDLKLVLFFTEHSCSDCRNQELKHLKEIGKEIGNENIVILVTNEDGRITKEFKEINFAPAYMVKNVNWEEIIRAPILFMIDERRKATCVFRPSADLPLQSLDYYEVIKKRFFSTSNQPS